MPELFDQMHVVNEGRFASRYFPGVGLWIAPFLAMGHPYGAEWLAGGLAAFFVFWAGRELAGNGVGLAAGLLTALSPGMGLFSNLLLSHEPTMAALALFLVLPSAIPADGPRERRLLGRLQTELRDALPSDDRRRFRASVRPLVPWRLAGQAAGLPKPTPPGNRPLATGRPTDQQATWRWPLHLPLVWPGRSFLYDRAITGNGFVSPYQLYTDTYTPRHVYGFNNVLRGEQRLGPKVLDKYDRWAENLTPRLAVENVAARAAASARWTLGTVPLTMAVVVFVSGGPVVR